MGTFAAYSVQLVAGTDAERFLEESGCRWLAKPFRLKDLLRVAKEMVE